MSVELSNLIHNDADSTLYNQIRMNNPAVKTRNYMVGRLLLIPKFE